MNLSPSGKLLHALRNRAATITDELEDSKLFEHRGDRGTFREGIIRRFLRPFLPECYGLASGEAFSHDGQSSRQLDVVVHDPIFSTVLFRDRNDDWLFPCESIYGSVEVKSNLSGDELRASIKNVASLKCLPRESTTMLDFLPTVRLELGGGLAASPQVRNPYFGVVFAYDGISHDNADAILGEAATTVSKDHLPESIFVYKQGYVLFKSNQGIIAPLGSPCDGYQHMQVNQNVMPIFYLTLITYLHSIRLKTPNMNEYWLRAVREAINE